MQFILRMINLDWIRNNILEVHVTLICKYLRKKILHYHLYGGAY